MLLRAAAVLTALLLTTGCGAAAKQRVVAQSSQPAVTYVSTDGVRFAPGPDRDDDGLDRARWNEVRYEDGRLHLGFRRCLEVRHVDVGPPDGAFRRVSVWARRPRATADCVNAIQLAVPADWTRATIATPDRVFLPNPELEDDHHTERVTAILQPDRRTLLAGYGYGGCEQVAAAEARRAGRAITVTVTTGADYDEDGSCAEALFGGLTVARLPEPAPPGAFVVG